MSSRRRTRRSLFAAAAVAVWILPFAAAAAPFTLNCTTKHRDFPGRRGPGSGLYSMFLEEGRYIRWGADNKTGRWEKIVAADENRIVLWAGAPFGDGSRHEHEIRRQDGTYAADRVCLRNSCRVPVETKIGRDGLAYNVFRTVFAGARLPQERGQCTLAPFRAPPRKRF